MKIKSGLLVGLGAVGLWLSLATTSEAFGVNTCLTSAPNATLTIGPNGESVSPDTSYTNSLCKGYVVDVKVQSVPNGYSFNTDGGLASVPTNQAQCELAQDHVAYYYKKAGSTDWVTAGGGYRKGHWTGNNFPINTCMMNAASGFVLRSGGGVNNGDTWRVVVRAVSNVEPARVRVGAGTQFIPT